MRAQAPARRALGLVRVCAWCQRRCLHRSGWQAVEVSRPGRGDADLTHGVCPACRDQILGEERERLAREAAGSPG